MADKNKFTPGDQVQHKSGGPQMTVDSYDQYKDVHCSWMNRDSNGSFKKESDSFKEASLKLWEPLTSFAAQL
ncbi:MAG: YodC family protein [Rhabdaerophilum sp.]